MFPAICCDMYPEMSPFPSTAQQIPYLKDAMSCLPLLLVASGESAHCPGDLIDSACARAEDVQFCGMARQENRVQEVMPD